MAALSLRGATDPGHAARALEVRSHAIAEYFTSEVLDQQPPEVAWFMLDTSILGELTADACAAITGRQDAAALLRSIDAASLFLVALDEDRTTALRYRPHLADAYCDLLPPGPARRGDIPAQPASTPRLDPVVVEPLSNPEREVLRFAESMLSTEEIAGAMFLSVNTVKSHLKSIFRKLGANRRGEAVRRAKKLGLI